MNRVALSAIVCGGGKREGKRKTSAQVLTHAPVIFAPDSAYDPFGEAGSVLLVQPSRPQHPDMQSLQLREAYRSDARRNVGFDDA